MPYIQQFCRELLDRNLTQADTPGELNYCLTRLLIAYFQRNGRDYQAINDCIGALECAKLEFTRRVVNPYEDVKQTANGDVYQGV